jgi:hypothetical protein
MDQINCSIGLPPYTTIYISKKYPSYSILINEFKPKDSECLVGRKIVLNSFPNGTEEESLIKKIRNRKPEYITYPVEILELEGEEFPNFVSEFHILKWEVDGKVFKALVEYPFIRPQGIQAVLQNKCLYLVGGNVDLPGLVGVPWGKCRIEIDLAKLEGVIDIKIIHPKFHGRYKTIPAHEEIITTVGKDEGTKKTKGT